MFLFLFKLSKIQLKCMSHICLGIDQLESYVDMIVIISNGTQSQTDFHYVFNV